MERTHQSWSLPNHASEGNFNDRSDHRSHKARAVAPNEKLGNDLATYGLSDEVEKFGTPTLPKSTDDSYARLSEASMNESDYFHFKDRSSTHTTMARTLSTHARQPSHISSRRPSYASTRKPSQLSSQSLSNGEAWEDLETANQEWRERTWDKEGVQRIEPSLLLPEADED